ncbi:thiamine pyrophosphate-binding protein [Leucobacter sp. UCMA 4100]|uniref:thiamine pyrophosphate-binding protein n=1 Tax=Leucobacter sp. UCMA 4100 TaxID=2810534 RepID=UPI0022EA4F9D|nr:thiamine pyrophosphate-binding protein [Leucobacter sp. UCMA 4100]MDA3147314.1 thiamine pyrophosphate-binding protein [Leucobacter sp. UCMA 4100]
MSEQTLTPPQTPFIRDLAAGLAAHTEQVFGLMGNGNAHLIDALRDLGLAFTPVRHEAATVASADAYARVSGKLAVATTTYGAGFTNTLTALAEAAQARVPVLVVVGDEPVAGKRPWDVDAAMLSRAVGAEHVVLSADRVADEVRESVALALEKRLPVVLAMPYDLVSVPVAARENLATGDVTDVASVARLLATAKRPVVLAGRGAVLAGAERQLAELVALTGAATASTALARGIHDPAADLGVTGGFGQEAAMATLETADVVVAVGASLNQFTMRFGDALGEGAQLIRIDAERVQAPRTNHRVSQHLLLGDARELLEALNGELREANATPASFGAEVARGVASGELSERETGPESGVCEDGRLDPRAVASRIAALLPEDAHITQDGGHFIAWANMFLPVAKPEHMTMVGTAYQTIGLGFGTVAGVAAAAPGRTIVLSTGDGGGLMALADFETAIRTAQSLVVVCFNDAAYGAEVHLYGVMGLRQEPMLIPDVDFAALGEAFGAEGVRVETLADLDALERWREAGARGAIVLDCRVSRSVVAPYQREVQRVNGVAVSAT